MSSLTYAEVHAEWVNASAFLVDGYVCGDWSLPSTDELPEAEQAAKDDGYSDYEPCVSFYIYGEHGLKREYFVDRAMVEAGQLEDGRLRVIYDDKKPMEIVPLVRKGTKSLNGA